MIMIYRDIRYVRSMSVNILYREILLKDNVLRLFYRDIRSRSITKKDDMGIRDLLVIMIKFFYRDKMSIMMNNLY